MVMVRRKVILNIIQIGVKIHNISCLWSSLLWLRLF